MQKVLLLCFLLCFFLSTRAQTILTKDSAVQLTNVKITVNANSFSATTKVEMEIFNPNPKVLDGEVAFSLTEGQVISAFQLDINGKMRDGVMVEKQKARVAYENVIRRQVDPGLFEMTAANQYRIRVYPVPATGRRQITFTVQQLLVPNGQLLNYRFPLNFSVLPRNLRAEVSVVGDAAPFASEGLLKEQAFRQLQVQYKCDYASQSITAKAVLAFSIPLTQTTSVCTADEDCGTMFFARVTPDSLRIPATTSATITVFWDVSASASKRDIQREIQFLEHYLKLRQPQQLRVVTFAIDPIAVKTFLNPASGFRLLRNFLENQKQDGGTRLNRLRCADYPADEYLLFSDGQNTFGEGGIITNSKPVFCIQSALSANTVLLKQMTSATAGKLVNLTDLTTEQAIQNLQQAEWNIIISDKEQKRLNLSWRKIGNTFFIVGNSSDKPDTLWLQFAYANQQQRIPLVLGESTCKASSVAAATDLLQGLNVTESGGEAAQDFATAHEWISANTSLIVLDALEDYHQYGINPPADLLEEFKKRYPLQPDKKGEKKKDEEILVYRNLQTAVNEYNQKLRWWNPQLSPLLVKSPAQKQREMVVAANENAPTMVAVNPVLNNSSGFKSSSLSEVVVIGYGTRRRANITGSVSTVSANQLSTTTTVQQALAGRVAG